MYMGAKSCYHYHDAKADLQHRLNQLAIIEMNERERNRIQSQQTPAVAKGWKSKAQAFLKRVFNHGKQSEKQ